MKKQFCGFALLLALALLFTACASSQKAVLPPVRYGKAISHAMIEAPETFSEAYAEADVVAHIRIGDWLSEDDISTYYEAEILNCYKGTTKTQISLKQHGTSESTLNGFPLFTSGNEMLIFLKECTPGYITYPDQYWMLGGYAAVFEALKTNNGEVYFIDRFGRLSESIDADLNVRNQPVLNAELQTNAVKADPVYEDFTYSYVFKKSDLERLMEQLK